MITHDEMMGIVATEATEAIAGSLQPDCSARSLAEAWAVEWQGTRRDTCFAIGEKMLLLSESQAAAGWRSLAGALMRLGEKDVPKFMDLIANINAATMVGGLRGKAQNARERPEN